MGLATKDIRRLELWRSVIEENVHKRLSVRTVELTSHGKNELRQLRTYRLGICLRAPQDMVADNANVLFLRYEDMLDET